MPWSCALANERERYLRQQMELGGEEVVLSRRAATEPASEPATETTDADGTADEGVGAGTEDGDERGQADMGSAKKKPAAAGGGQKKLAEAGDGEKWRKGAPAIPGPGLTIEAPPPTGLGAELVKLKTLEEVAERIRSTFCCDLCPSRKNAVPGEGDPHARLMLVGEGPGATEDQTGRPFVGQAGQLLDSILEAIDVPRNKVYITNIVKCRPPQNRKPLPDEVASCIPYLYRQLELIRPKVILALGGTAGESLLGVKKSLGELRNKVHTFHGIPLVVTYHPAALLRNPNWKKPTWDDVRIARQLLDR
jgi:uracil-DNA glycosylase family 4